MQPKKTQWDLFHLGVCSIFQVLVHLLFPFFAYFLWTHRHQQREFRFLSLYLLKFCLHISLLRIYQAILLFKIKHQFMLYSLANPNVLWFPILSYIFNFLSANSSDIVVCPEADLQSYFILIFSLLRFSNLNFFWSPQIWEALFLLFQAF